MKSILVLYPLIFLSLITSSRNANAQIETPKPPPAASIKEPDVEQQVKMYTSKFDSLLLEERYRNIIDIGELLAMDREPRLATVPLPYLICAYHFIGNTERSKKLLNDTISKLEYNELIDLLTNNHIAFIKYFNAPGNRAPIIEQAIKDYKKSAIATDKEAGEQIIRLFINDQSSRKVKYCFKKDDQVAQSNVEKNFRSLTAFSSLTSHYHRQ